MPTANRRRFVPAAIRLFLAQDYPEKELIILDDGDDKISDLVPCHPQIRYFRENLRRPVGAKRNECVREAQGEIIVHWDDDDWYASWRLRYQVQELLQSGCEVCGLDRVLFFEAATSRAWEYVYPKGAAPWVCGATLCYQKIIWHRNPFPEISIGEDTRFVFQVRAEHIKALPENRFFVGTVHDANTSRRQTCDPRWQPISAEVIHALMGYDLLLYTASGAHNIAKPRDGTGGTNNDLISGTTEKLNQVQGANRMKLNLGCCDTALQGFVNVDIIAGRGVDLTADLRQRWPWPNDSVEYIRAFDIIEHLPDKIFTMNELWRVLIPGGAVDIAVPTTDGTGAFQDPTHVSFWNRRSFLYYEAGNPYRERFARHYGIQAKFRIDQEKTEQTPDGPRLRLALKAIKP